jgi:hypothetical protein
MNDAQVSTGHRVAAWLARCAVRAWPEETRKWGLALEAELAEIEGPSASVRWALGGIMLLTRAWWNHLMHSWMRPAGVPESGPLAALAKNASRVPRTPRFVTALLLLASVGLLLTGDSRQALSTGFHAWKDDSTDQYYRRAMKLREEAKRTQDPQLLAFAALVYIDDNDELRLSLAREAVRRDASLTWIYSKIRRNEKPCCMLHSLDEQGIIALQKWDPENALPRILAADVIYEHVEKSWFDKGMNGTFNVDKVVRQDPNWLAAMDSAFRAPKFDSYQAQEFALYRDVAYRYDIREAGLVLSIFWNSGEWQSHRQINLYNQLLWDTGDAALATGKFDDAAALYRKPLIFAEQVMGQDQTANAPFELPFVERTSYQKLIPVLEKTGRKDEESLARYQFQSVETQLQTASTARRWRWLDADGWTGLAIRSLTLAIPVLGLLVLLSFGFLFVGRNKDLNSRGRGFAFASWGIDCAPLLLLTACTGLFVVWQPLAFSYWKTMSSPWHASTLNDLMDAVLSPYAMPESYRFFSYNYLNAYHYWIVAIAALLIIAFYVLFRGTLRRRTALP